MEVPFLQDIFIIFALAIAVVFVCQLLRIPPIVGFLVTGALAGPYGLKLVGAVHEVEVLAEIGVILLLFTIGIEFSLKDLLKIRRLVLVGGTLQVLLTIAVTWLLATVFGQPPVRAVFLGFLVALSSTAIVLKLLQERSEISAPQGRAVLGVLILQDVAIVPMMLCVPLMAGGAADLLLELLTLLLKGATIVVLAVVGTQWVVPWMLTQIARTRSNELFLLGLAVICFGVAWLTHALGLSLALGAFMAGLIISESEYSHRALGNVLPFRDVFTSFFFVSVGMLLDVSFAVQNLLVVVVVASGIILLKATVAAGVIVGLGMPLRVAALSGLALGQVGEFSFVLSKTGLEYGLLPPDLYQWFLVVSLLTMVATPFVLSGSHRMADWVGRLPLPERWKAGRYFVATDPASSKRDHVVIVGYGVIGRNLARSAKMAGVDYVIIEINDETVREEKANGEPIFYGDASQSAALEHANLANARVLVAAIPDPVATRRVVDSARCLNPAVHIIARTRYLQEMDELERVGANEVVPEEFEASVAIFSRVLSKYLIPAADVERYAGEVRADGYRMFRQSPKALLSISDADLARFDVEVRVFRLADGSEFADRTLAETNLRREHDVSVLMVRRGEEVSSNPAGDFLMVAGDVLVLLGKPESIRRVTPLLEGQSDPAPQP